MTEPFSALIGESPQLRSVIRAAQLVARTDATVLLEGETGTGKELLAQGLHAASRRAKGPFVSINCAALPEPLAEAELFGHERGAFTGADRSRPGHVRRADGGTLFLDEIGEMPLAVQARLLRLIEQGEIQPLGEQRIRQVDVRIIAATHQPLERLVREGRFRRDLYFRLSVVPLALPSLRERGGDSLLLAEHFLDHFSRLHGCARPRLTAAARRALLEAEWPGNVRELRNLCERLCILLPGQSIEPGNLVSGAATAETLTEADFPTLDLAELERAAIRRALARSHGNKSRAARLLGISRDTLNYRLRKYALA
ncbi:MAG: AAA family ATPase [Gammaproteobacteria bacterium]|nr:MAG: AAA family ATPase [Gammaproteobacteria bacterium]